VKLTPSHLDQLPESEPRWLATAHSVPSIPPKPDRGAAEYRKRRNVCQELRRLKRGEVAFSGKAKLRLEQCVSRVMMPVGYARLSRLCQRSPPDPYLGLLHSWQHQMSPSHCSSSRGSRLLECVRYGRIGDIFVKNNRCLAPIATYLLVFLNMPTNPSAINLLGQNPQICR